MSTIQSISFLLAWFALSQQPVHVSAGNGLCPPGSVKVVYNFNRYPDGSKTRGGDMAEDIWGETSTSEGVRIFGKNLRIFDSSNPTGGNYELGSPNKGCEVCSDRNVSCPGVANEGEDQGSAATNNCRPQREILIFGSEEGGEDPKAEEGEGYMDIYFDRHVPKLLSIGFINMQKGWYQIWSGLEQTNANDFFDESLGQNTVQQQRFNLFDPFLIGEMYLQFDGPVGITHVKFCASEPDNPEFSICAYDPANREAAFQKIEDLEDEFLVARYDNFNLGPGLYDPIRLGDCCYLQRVGDTISVRACGESGQSIVYGSFQLIDRKGSPEAVEYLAAQLRNAAAEGACCLDID